MIAGGNGISTGIGITKRCAVTGELFADEARNLARVLEGAFGTSCVIRLLVSCGIWEPPANFEIGSLRLSLRLIEYAARPSYPQN